MKVPFTKMHGLGNDFVVIDIRKGPDFPWQALAPKILDRRFGVGGDQLLLLSPSVKGDVFMKIYERDGLETEMCGNGIRCVGRFLSESGLEKDQYQVETLGGLKTIEYRSASEVTVDMGPPIFEPDKIPVASKEKVWGKEFVVGGHRVKLHTLSMGNPHAVIFVENIAELSWVGDLGPKLEYHELFPNRTNVEFVYPKSKSEMVVRVWERGAGETLACGTGACAAAVASIETGRAVSPLNIQFRNGSLQISWAKGGSVQMTGPATRVYDGEIDL